MRTHNKVSYTHLCVYMKIYQYINVSIYQYSNVSMCQCIKISIHQYINTSMYQNQHTWCVMHHASMLPLVSVRNGEGWWEKRLPAQFWWPDHERSQRIGREFPGLWRGKGSQGQRKIRVTSTTKCWKKQEHDEREWTSLKQGRYVWVTTGGKEEERWNVSIGGEREGENKWFSMLKYSERRFACQMMPRSPM